MIGKVYLSVVDYYDARTGATRRKTRPVLVVGGPNENDYTVLPISTIPHREHVNAHYDILIPAQERVVLSLNSECFIRAHKQIPMHTAALLRPIGDMKKDAPSLYLDALGKMEEFQKNVLNYAI